MMAGQTINDRLLAARHSIAGQGLAKSVCKATTEEMIAPKKKHLDYLVHCTNEPNVSIPQLATLLVERAQSTNWVVVFKALVTTHHLLAYGNERFTQYLASSNSSFQLSNFLDKSGVQAGAAGARIGYDMSPFIRRYARYLNEKALSYRTVAFDFCKVKRGSAEGSLRTLGTDALLKTLAALQQQLDALLEFDCGANDLTNGVINMCFMLLFRDLIRLFACYNDGIINLLEKYFDMNKKQAREALDLYKKFLIRMDRVGEFLKVAESVGIDRGDIPDLTRAPSSLLDALEQHLAVLDPKHQATPSASAAKQVAGGVGALSSTSQAFAAAGAGAGAANGGGVLIDDALARQALADEELAMNQYKTKVSPPGSNPFLSLGTPPTPSPAPMVDLFSSAPAPAPAPPSEDLLSLANPFADVLFASQPQQQPLGMGGGGGGGVWGAPEAMGGAVAGGGAGAGGAFVTDDSFSSVFSATSHHPAHQQQGVCGGGGGGGGVLTGDLESSLAQLAQNLDINARTNKMPALGRGAWSPQPLPNTAQPHYRPMGAGMPLPPPLTLHHHPPPPPPSHTHLATAGPTWARPFPAASAPAHHYS